MMKSMALALVSVMAFGLPLSASGQATLAFNNLDPRAEWVTICPGLQGPTPVLLNQDLNFALLAGSVGAELKTLHVWLLSGGSAKGIHVAPGRFKDPSDGIYTVPGVAPGAAVEICVLAWPGHYATPSYGARASRAYGVMLTAPAGVAPPSLFTDDLTVYGVPVPYSLLALGLARSNGIPQISLTGRVGYGAHETSVLRTVVWSAVSRFPPYSSPRETETGNTPFNDADQWRAADDVEMETEALSARPLEQPE